MPLQKICKEKQQLATAYSLAVTRYSSEVRALVNSSNVEDPEKYEEAHRLVEAARKTPPKPTKILRITARNMAVERLLTRTCAYSPSGLLPIRRNRITLRSDITMRQAKPKLGTEAETCFECRPVIGMLEDLDVQVEMLTSEQAKAASLRERVRIEDWLKQAPDYGTALHQSDGFFGPQQRTTLGQLSMSGKNGA